MSLDLARIIRSRKLLINNKNQTCKMKTKLSDLLSFTLASWSLPLIESRVEKGNIGCKKALFFCRAHQTFVSA